CFWNSNLLFAIVCWWCVALANHFPNIANSLGDLNKLFCSRLYWISNKSSSFSSLSSPPFNLYTFPVTIFVAGILLTNNIRDVDGDKANGRNTFAILVGRKKATTTLAGMIIFASLLT